MFTSKPVNALLRFPALKPTADADEVSLTEGGEAGVLTASRGKSVCNGGKRGREKGQKFAVQPQHCFCLCYTFGLTLGRLALVGICYAAAAPCLASLGCQLFLRTMCCAAGSRFWLRALQSPGQVIPLLFSSVHAGPGPHGTQPENSPLAEIHGVPLLHMVSLAQNTIHHHGHTSS